MRRSPPPTDLTAIKRLLRDQADTLDAIQHQLDRLRLGPTLDLLGTKDVCRILGIGRTKLYALINAGDLPMWKLGGRRCITRTALEAYIRRQTPTPPPPPSTNPRPHP